MVQPGISLPSGGVRGSSLERLADPIMWVWCWAAYRLVMVLPMHWRLSWRLLPFAGYYAFHVPEAPWRWSERVR